MADPLVMRVKGYALDTQMSMVKVPMRVWKADCSCWRVCTCVYKVAFAVSLTITRQTVISWMCLWIKTTSTDDLQCNNVDSLSLTDQIIQPVISILLYRLKQFADNCCSLIGTLTIDIWVSRAYPLTLITRGSAIVASPTRYANGATTTCLVWVSLDTCTTCDNI